MKVLFFPNGNTAVFDDEGHQIPTLQEPWFLLFVEFLKQHYLDPAIVEFTMPDGSTKATYMPTYNNWQLSP